MWQTLSPAEPAAPRPSPRLGAAMVWHAGALYVIGGESDDRTVGDAWSFRLAERSWEQLPSAGCIQACPNATTAFNATHCLRIAGSGDAAEREAVVRLSCVGTVTPPPLRDHTATLLDGEQVLVIGGISHVDEFENRMFVLDLAAREWKQLPPNRHRYTEVAGHSAIYYPASRAVYVYGGFRPYHARYSDASSLLLVYHIDTRIWAEVRSAVACTQANFYFGIQGVECSPLK